MDRRRLRLLPPGAAVSGDRMRLAGTDIPLSARLVAVVGNPPFGGKERKEVQQNFPIRTGETAFLFMQHFIKMLRAGGRAAAPRGGVHRPHRRGHRQRAGQHRQVDVGVGRVVAPWPRGWSARGSHALSRA